MDEVGKFDRLLPRRELTTRVQIAWDVKPPRRFSRRGEEFVMATIIDLSLDGALLEVPDSSDHEVNDIVSLRFGGVDGRALVRHRRNDASGAGMIRYGIQWVGLPELRAVVERAVAAIRDENDELRPLWEGPHR